APADVDPAEGPAPCSLRGLVARPGVRVAPDRPGRSTAADTRLQVTGRTHLDAGRMARRAREHRVDRHRVAGWICEEHRHHEAHSASVAAAHSNRVTLRLLSTTEVMTAATGSRDQSDIEGAF